MRPITFSARGTDAPRIGARVARPEGIVRLDYEPELVFVIGERAPGVKQAVYPVTGTPENCA